MTPTFILGSLVIMTAAYPSAWQALDARALPGHELKILSDGTALTEERLALIDSARQTIDLAVFELGADDASRLVAGHLCAKAREGVDVRLLLNSHSSRRFRGLAPGLRACGAQVLFYSPIRWALSNFRAVLHEKLLDIDGRRMIIGGSNYSDVYANHSFDSTKWHDLDLRVTGPAACWSHYRFAREWARVARMETSGHGGSRAGKTFRGCAYLEGSGNSRVFPLEQDPIFTRGTQLLDAHLRAIRASERRIRLYSPYFTPHAKLLRALLEARARGVDVSIVTNSARSDDEGATYLGMLRIAEPLLRAGVRILLWNKPGLFHRKGGVFDDRLAFLGSDNLDRAAHIYNAENIIYTDDTAVIRELDALMDRDEAASLPFTLEQREAEYRSHSWLRHLEIWLISRFL